jgi:hypothetical protein
MANTLTSKRKKWLVFIDANILLDFYRLAGQSAIRQLQALERHRANLILGDQLRMEFMNNRQRAIIAGIDKLTRPERPTLPAILLDSQPAKTWIKTHGTAETKFKKVKSRIETILANPTGADPVYQYLTRIFDHDCPFNLRRPDKKRYTIRNLARKRFALGYPPRKLDATSLGDSLHWEWIIACAKESKDLHNVIIVSRDSDFGVTYGGKSILNDWLYREFKERVSQKRDVRLSQRLTDALKLLEEQVEKEDLEEENRIIRVETNSVPKSTQEQAETFTRFFNAWAQQIPPACWLQAYSARSASRTSAGGRGRPRSVCAGDRLSRRAVGSRVDRATHRSQTQDPAKAAGRFPRREREVRRQAEWDIWHGFRKLELRCSSDRRFAAPQRYVSNWA